MKYVELKIYASEAGVEQITALLMTRGIEEISIDDPADMGDILNKKHEYGWDYIEDELKEHLDREPVISVYFGDDEDGRRSLLEVQDAVQELKRASENEERRLGLGLGSLTMSEKLVDDADWKDRWKEFFKPTRITDRITVKPSWEEYDPHTGELVVEIDPGMAFGTGTHETTSLCIELMEKFMGDNPAERKVLDVGCGSGILSICAALLGSLDVLGIDIDEDAVLVARDNVAANDVADAVRVQQGDLTRGVSFSADVVVANLMADLVMLLAEDVGRHMKPGGVFISSGILTEKEEVVADALKDAGFSILEVASKGEWCAIAASLA